MSERFDIPSAAPWRIATALAGPALLVLVGVISPINDADAPAERLADVFANEGRYTATLFCLATGLLLLVPATYAVRDLAPLTARRTATAGATIAAAGFMLFTIASGALGFAPSAWSTLPDAQQGDLVAAFAAMDEGKGALGPILVGPVLPVLGLGLLSASLWRHTSLPRAALVAVPLGWAVFLFSPNNPLRSLGAAIVLAGLAALLGHGRARTPA